MGHVHITQVTALNPCAGEGTGTSWQLQWRVGGARVGESLGHAWHVHVRVARARQLQWGR